MKLLAADNLGTFKGLGPLGNFRVESTGTFAFSTFTTMFSTGIGVLTVAAGIWFIFQIFAGAYQWLASGGEKQGIENARKRITNAVIGLFVVVISYALIGIIGMIFGINILSPYKSIIGIPLGNGGGALPPCVPGQLC